MSVKRSADSRRATEADSHCGSVGAVVAEYTANELADDSGDEKRLVHEGRAGGGAQGREAEEEARGDEHRRKA